MTGPALTIAEAAPMLNPPITERALRDIVRALHIPPSGQRRNGQAGKPPYEYDWAELVKLHAALVPWLASRPSFHA